MLFFNINIVYNRKGTFPKSRLLENGPFAIVCFYYTRSTRPLISSNTALAIPELTGA